MRNVPYTFPSQPQPPSEWPGPATNPQPKASMLQPTQPSQLSLGPGPRQVNPPPGLSTTEWAAIQRMRENIGGEVSRPSAPSPTLSASPSPESESESERILSKHEDFVELWVFPWIPRRKMLRSLPSHRPGRCSREFPRYHRHSMCQCPGSTCSSKSLCEAVFSRKFPAGRSNEASFLTLQSIDQEAEKHFRMWFKKDLSAKKPLGTDTASHLAVAEQLSVCLDKHLASVNRLSALLIQIQVYIQHAMAEQAKLLQSLGEDPATPIPSLD